MFTKIFRSIYDGTLAENWQALVTFQQVLILSNQDGVVDMTPAAIARTTGIPLEIITAGIEFLEQPDPMSRSKEMDGQRIARLDPGRDWGWFVVNHAEYRRRISREEKLEADRQRVAAGRAVRRLIQPPSESGSELSRPVATFGDQSQSVATRRDQSQEVANVAHTDTELDAEKSHAFSVGKHTQVDSRATPTETSIARAEPGERTGQIARLLRSNGIAHVNPTHFAILELAASGATDAEIVDMAKEAVERGKPIVGWVCKTLIGRKRDAANAPPIPPQRAVPVTGSGAHRPYVRQKRARRDPSLGAPTQFKELAAKLGIGRKAEVESDEPPPV